LAANVTIDDLERPDMLVFGVTNADTALRLRTLLQAEGWRAAQAHGRARPAGHGADRTRPQRRRGAALQRAARRPPGNAAIDCRDNKPGATAIAAFSPRTLPGFPIAAPLDWAQVQRGVTPDALTIKQPSGAGKRATATTTTSSSP